MIRPNSDQLSRIDSSGPSSPSASSLTVPLTGRRGAITSPPTPEAAELLELVKRAQAGDLEAQSDLVRCYDRRISGFVRSFVRQRDGIEDVVQMVFIKMVQRLTRLREPAVFESWLFTLARNTALDFLRRCRCRPVTVEFDAELFAIADTSRPDAASEIMNALELALVHLKPTDRNLVSGFVRGDSYRTLAEQEDLTLSAVKVRLHRVRPFLRTFLLDLTGMNLPPAKTLCPSAAERIGRQALHAANNFPGSAPSKPNNCGV